MFGVSCLLVRGLSNRFVFSNNQVLAFRFTSRAWLSIVKVEAEEVTTMQKLYVFVPLLNVVGCLYFLLIISLEPAQTSLGLDLVWEQPDVLLVGGMLFIVLATSVAKSRLAKMLGLIINIVVIGMMSVFLWWLHVPVLVTDYLWLWALLMIFNVCLIGWGWMQLWGR